MNTARPFPIGATITDGGVNFSLFSRTAEGVELLFFDRENDARPARAVRLDPVADRTYHYWHTFVPGLKPGQVYQARTRNDQGGFPADARYWESVVPVLSWDGRALHDISLMPISLGWKDPRHRRGRPRLAGQEEGRAILERFAALSRPFGTTIDVAGAAVTL